MCSFVPLVKYYFVTMEEDDNQLKITYQFCGVFVKFQVGVENFSTLTFSVMEFLFLDYTLKILLQKYSTFSGPPELKCNACIIIF